MTKTENPLEVLEADFGVTPQKVSDTEYRIEIEGVEFVFKQNDHRWSYSYQAPPLSGYNLGSYPFISAAVRSVKGELSNLNIECPADAQENDNEE